MPRQGSKGKVAKLRPPSDLDIHDTSIHGLLQHMQDHQADAAKQAQSMRHLPHAFSEAPVKSHQDMTRAANAIITSMKTHPAHVDLQTSACSTLLWICEQGWKNLECLQQPDAFTTIVKAFISHPDHAKLQEASCSVLRSILDKLPPSLSSIIPACGLVDTFVQYLTAHAHDHVKQYMCMCALLYALKTVSKGTTKKKQLEKVVDAVLAGLRAHKDNTLVHLVCLSILSYILTANAFLADYMWEKDAIHVVLAAMNTCLLADDHSIKYLCGQVLMFKDFDSKDASLLALKAIAMIGMMHEGASSLCHPVASLSVYGEVLTTHGHSARRAACLVQSSRSVSSECGACRPPRYARCLGCHGHVPAA